MHCKVSVIFEEGKRVQPKTVTPGATDSSTELPKGHVVSEGQELTVTPLPPYPHYPPFNPLYPLPPYPHYPL